MIIAAGFLGIKGVAMFEWLASEPAIVFYWFPTGLIAASLAKAFGPEIASFIIKRETVADLGNEGIAVADLGRTFADSLRAKKPAGVMEFFSRFHSFSYKLNALKVKYVELDSQRINDPAHIDDIAATLRVTCQLLRDGNLKAARSTSARIVDGLNQDATLSPQPQPDTRQRK